MQLRRLLAVISPLVLGAGLLAPTSTASAAPDFYTPPSTIAGPVGTVVKNEPMEFLVDPIIKNKVNAFVQRVMYVSDSRGERVPVTGTIFTPKRVWTGKGERPLVAIAPGTQGLGDQCAPSRQGDVGNEYEVMMLTKFLNRNYAVVMTDYEGLGTPGVHTYMMRETQGHAVLDSIRAAQRLPEANIPDAGPVAIVGYSQGGGGAAAAAELAATYAPELNIVGVAAGAVPADLSMVASNLDGGLYVGYELYAIRGMTAEYGLSVDGYLNDKGRAITAAIEGQCWIDTLSKYAFTKTSSLTADGRSATEMMKDEPFKSILDQQLIGRVKPSMPVYVFHSVNDDIIPYAAGRKMAKSWCQAGARVQFSTGLTIGHIAAWLNEFTNGAPSWVDQRFLGWTAPSNCWALR